MMKVSLFSAILMMAIPCHAVTPSSGCGEDLPSDQSVGTLFHQSMSIKDTTSRLHGTRGYQEYIPSSYDSNTPMPIVIYFHGQYSNAKSDAEGARYMEVGEKNGFISMYPQGLGRSKDATIAEHSVGSEDYSATNLSSPITWDELLSTDDESEARNCGTGWNIGAGGHDPNTCNSKAKKGSTCCYETCMSLDVCTGDDDENNCGWSTCFNDVYFFEEALAKVASEVCVDLDAVFLTGASNGGMMTHALSSALPTTFKAVMPVYGLPLVGHIDVPQALEDTWILQLHDRSDHTIPYAGGYAGGWNYESAVDTLAAWAEVHECDSSPVNTTTPYDGGDKNLACTEWPSCSKGRVMFCLYDGVHGSWPPQEEDLTWWFFSQASTEIAAFA